MNFFAGPSNSDFTANINLYNTHYTSTHILGSTGGNTDDLKEAIDLSAKGKIHPAVMVSHICGIDAIAKTTAMLPNLKGGKVLSYTQINMPLTAIADFEEKGKTDPLFAKLHECVAKNNGVWNVEAEKAMLDHFSA